MDDIVARIRGMKAAHRDLDDAIAALMATAGRDELELARLKRRKLRLKDEIAQCEDMMLPDIIA